MSLRDIFLAAIVGICAISGGSGFVMNTALITWKIVKSIDWLAVTSRPVAQLLLFSMEYCTASVLLTESVSRLVQNGKECFMALPLLPAVSYLQAPPSRASVSRTVAKYIYRTYWQSVPSSNLNELFFEQDSNVSSDLREDTAPVTANAGCSARVQDDV